MKTFYRYHLQEYFFYTFCFFISFTLIITFIKGIFSVQKLYELNPNFKDMFKYFFLIFLQLLSFTYPLAAFFGTLFTIHRLKEEKELLGFLCLGFKIKDFLKPLTAFILISVFWVFIFNFWLLPWTKKEQKLIKFYLAKKQSETSLKEKQPILITKQHIIYVEKAERKNSQQILEKVFMIEQTPLKKQIFLSETGKLDPENNLVVLINGKGFSLSVKKEIEIFSFKKYAIYLSFNKTFETLELGRGEMSFKQLKEKIRSIPPGTSQFYKYVTEYWERLLYPILTIFLIIQCVILGLWMKFHHKFWVFFIGITVYVGFYMLYQFFKTLGENGKIYPLYGFFLCYVLFSIVIGVQILILRKVKHKIWI